MNARIKIDVDARMLLMEFGGEIITSLKAAQEGNTVAIVSPSKNKSLDLSLSNKAITKKAESDHPRHGQEGSNETTCCWDHLSQLATIISLCFSLTKSWKN
ncbi:hypothetical protein CR513_17480, partial [Mucuna pruriens]